MDPINVALEITAIGMTGIFAFMFIFYISIRLIDKFYPGEKPVKEQPKRRKKIQKPALV